MPNFEDKKIEPVNNADVLLEQYSKLLAGRKEADITDPAVLAALENLKRSLRAASVSEIDTERVLFDSLSSYEAQENIEIKNILSKIRILLKSSQGIKDNILDNILPKCGPIQYKIISSELTNLSTELIESMEAMQDHLQTDRLDLNNAQQYLDKCEIIKNKLLKLYAQGREMVGD